MKQLIFSNWNLVRLARLLMGIAILVQAALLADVLFIVLGILFTALPVFNIGCGCNNSCYTAPPKKQTNEKEITYEEVG